MDTEVHTRLTDAGVRGDFLAVTPCWSVLQPFDEKWRLLADEADNLVGEEWIEHPDRHLTDRGWRLTPVRYFGANHPGAAQVAPVLTALVMRDHRIKGAAYYSLSPGTELAPHRGNPIGLARFHLGLRVPDSCAIRVGATTRKWREGEWLGFDDSIVHSAWNHSDLPRHVLVLDVEHPDVPVPAGAHFFRWASRTFYTVGREFPRLRFLAGRVSWLSRAGQRLSAAIDRHGRGRTA